MSRIKSVTLRNDSRTIGIAEGAESEFWAEVAAGSDVLRCAFTGGPHSIQHRDWHHSRLINRTRIHIGSRATQRF